MTEENTIQSKRNSLNIKAIIGELLIFLIFCVMLYFYFTTKNKILLLLSVILFIHLQIILLGLLYTYYYEIKNNSNADNLTYNVERGGNFYLTFIGIFLIMACTAMYSETITYIIFMMISLIFLFILLFL